jgi:CRP/FNR family transcriptional regulator, cyclic AMP receptor protein
VAQLPTFMAGLTGGAAQRIHALGRLFQYEPQADLLRLGDPVDDVIVLVTGLVKVFTFSEAGKQLILDLRGPGDLVGEMSAIDGAPRSATVTALVSTTARRIPAPAFLAALTAEPDLSLGLLRHLVRHLRDSDRNRLQYVATSAFDRIVGVLDDFALRHGERQPDGSVVVARGLSHDELAKAAAVSIEAFNKSLRKLRDAGLVSTGRRRALVISDLDLLRAAKDNLS